MDAVCLLWEKMYSYNFLKAWFNQRENMQLNETQTSPLGLVLLLHICIACRMCDCFSSRPKNQSFSKLVQKLIRIIQEICDPSFSNYVLSVIWKFIANFSVLWSKYLNWKWAIYKTSLCRYVKIRTMVNILVKIKDPC